MIATVYEYLLGFFSLSWLTGPIFNKELRVSSRRRRYYVLRFAYIAVLTLFLALIWLEEVSYRGSSLYRISRMSQAGQTIVFCIVWFQFYVTQLVALTIMSTSISDEIYKKTLGLLMSTPINSFQIVMGKLFSKLLQLVLLMAISLPMLAIVRVMGGVPWNFIISSLCITLTTVIFVGSVSLFYSIFTRRAYVVMIRAGLTIIFIFGLFPLIIYGLWDVTDSTISEKTLFTIIFTPNPYCVMLFNTITTIQPGTGPAGTTYYWPLHCGIILAFSAVILSLSMLLVRKVALAQATGQLELFTRKRRFRKKAANVKAEQGKSDTNIGRVKGPAVLWKELRVPLLGKRKIASIIFLVLGLLILLFSYWLFGRENMLDEEETHIFYAEIFISLGILLTIILPSTSITSEKESRAWPLLLATTLNDWQILSGKFFGALRRCLPVWCVLFGHIVFFTISGYIHPLAIFQMGILVCWIMVFLACSGIYFSSHFKHTTTAVIMNFILAVTIWAVTPILIAVISGITHTGDGFFENYMDANPFVHAAIIMGATANKGGLQTYDWVTGRLNFATSTFWLIGYMMIYFFLGLIFIARAKYHLRRNIF